MLLREEEKFYPGKEKPKTVLSLKDELDALNQTEWVNTLSQLQHHKVDSDARIRSMTEAAEVIQQLQKDPRAKKYLPQEHMRVASEFQSAQRFLSDARQTLNGLFHKAYKFGTDEDRAKLAQANKEFTEAMQVARKAKGSPAMLQIESQAVEGLITTLSSIEPQLYEPVEKFAIDKSAKTFANMALHGLLKYKDKAPTVNIENVFGAESAFSLGKELDALVKETKKQFVEEAKKKGFSESRAREKADELIGVTLDVGHLNVARKHGFKKEDLLKEIEPIAKHVKHVHLTDNFGSEDSHLIPGWGNVPFKEILEKLGKEGFKGTEIVEGAPGGVQLLGTKTFSKVLEAMGSPVFAPKETGAATASEFSYWNQNPGLQQNYSGGFGQMLPQMNYETFGGGFTNLPMELGGTRPTAKGSRLSGDPLE
jgi:hypothetical protein